MQNTTARTFMSRMALLSAKDENGDRLHPNPAPEHKPHLWWNGYNYEAKLSPDAVAYLDAQDSRGGAGT